MARSSRSNRNRVLDDRLWDTDGREWLLDLLAERLSREAIEAYVNSGRRIVVHQYREPLRWLAGIKPERIGGRSRSTPGPVRTMTKKSLLMKWA